MSDLKTFEQVQRETLAFIIDGGCDGECNGGSDVCCCPVDPFACVECGEVVKLRDVESFIDEADITQGRCSKCFHKELSADGAVAA